MTLFHELDVSSSKDSLDVDSLFGPPKKAGRVVKDVLYAATFRTARGSWAVDEAKLQDIADTYNLAHSRGVDSGLYWGSPVKQGQHNVEARNKIASIDAAAVCNGKLYISAYPDQATAAELCNNDHKVSVRVDDSFTSCEHEIFPNFLSHVAIVDHPVAHRQSKFVALSNDGTSEPVPLGEEADNHSLILTQVLSLVDELLVQLDLPTLAGIPRNNVVEAFKLQLRTLDHGNSKNAVNKSAAELEGTSEMELSDVQKYFDGKFTELSTEFDAKLENITKTRELSVRRDTFNGKLNRIFESNDNFTAAMRDSIAKSGEATAYDLALLDPFEAFELAAPKNVSLEEDEAWDEKRKISTATGFELSTDEETANQLLASGEFTEDHAVIKNLLQKKD
jgi:hypothetical protein